jgi:hypothetical protein
MEREIMNEREKRRGWTVSTAILMAHLAALPAGAQEKKLVPPGTPVTITVQPAAPAAPPVSFVLGARHGHVTPVRTGCTHTGGGTIDVAQPSPDTLVVTMFGVAVAYPACLPAEAGFQFDLEQCFEVSFDSPKVKKAKLTLEGRVIGLLRSHHKKGAAAFDNACAGVACGGVSLLHLCVPPHAVAGGENLSVNDHDGPVSVPGVVAGKYTLHQTFALSASAPKCLLPCKAPSAEFAPDPALDPLWISYKEPFHGAAKKDFGFQVTLKVADDTESAEPAKEPPGNGNGPERLPPPGRDEGK